MNIKELRAYLDALMANGLPETTPVVVFNGEEDHGIVKGLLEEITDMHQYTRLGYWNAQRLYTTVYDDTGVLALVVGGNPSFMDTEETSAESTRFITTYIDAAKQTVEASALTGTNYPTQIETTATQNALREVFLATDALDAARWRALLSSPAIRILGHSGCSPDNRDGSAHFGMEIWTHHDPFYNNEESAKTITHYADIMIRNNESSKTMQVTVISPDNLKELAGGSTEQLTAWFEGEGLYMTVSKEELAGWLNNPYPKSAIALARKRGICKSCTLIIGKVITNEKYFIHGVVLTDRGKFVRVSDDVADLWKLYKAQNDGTLVSVKDFGSRRTASMYLEALNK